MLYASQKKIEAAGRKAVVVLGDLTQDKEVTGMLDEAERLLGGIDILVNNAGGSGEKQVWEKTAASDWAAAYDRNVLAAVRVTNRLINISSLARMMPPAMGPDYSACKAAMNNLSLSLAKSAAPYGITVNTISSGAIMTPSWKQHSAGWQSLMVGLMKSLAGLSSSGQCWPHVVQVPLGRVGKADDVANAVAFLCSPRAGYITGVDLRIDGGVMPAL